VRVAHAVRVDLADVAGLADERVRGRDPVLPVGAVRAVRVDPQDLPLRDTEILRVVVARRLSLTAVAGGDVEQAVVLVAALGVRVEADLLNAVDLAGVAEPEYLSARSVEGARGRVVRRPFVDDTVVNGVRLGRQVRIFVVAEASSVWAV
jgi:hypothetical protein